MKSKENIREYFIASGFSYSITKETEKAILAEITTCDNRRIFSKWIPKSIIMEDRREFAGSANGIDFYNVYVDIDEWWVRKELGLW